ncbi:MAG TPA: hypothetical protein VN408_14215, partial [Actinoplanes sp.]|nr:hypothetical protein [Actinoplanes sp.]
MTLVQFDQLESSYFAVDVQRRTVRGLLAPWGKIGRHADGRKWRFARGSLLYSHFKYLRLNDEHTAVDVGRAIDAEDT